MPRVMSERGVAGSPISSADDWWDGRVAVLGNAWVGKPSIAELLNELLCSLVWSHLHVTFQISGRTSSYCFEWSLLRASLTCFIVTIWFPFYHPSGGQPSKSQPPK